MYKSLISLIVVSFFVSCSSTVPVNKNASISGNKTSHVNLGSGKSYCRSNGGDWSWNGRINKWECNGFDMSSFYDKKYANANEQEKILLKERMLKQEKENERIAKINKCLQNNKVYTRDNEIDVVIDSCRNLMWEDRDWDSWQATQSGDRRGSQSESYDDAIKVCQKEVSTGGYLNWRLPSMSELSSIVDKSQKPAINKIFKNGIVKATKSKPPIRGSLGYWTTAQAFLNVISFRSGSPSHTQKKAQGIVVQARYVKCVRDMPISDKIFNIQDSRKANILGTKSFKNVKLINGVLWEDQAYNRGMNDTYSSCRQHCKSLNLLGVNQWQVPTREQYNQIRYKSYKKLENIGQDKSVGMGILRFKYFTKDECTYNYFGDKYPGVYGVGLGLGSDCIRKNASAVADARGCRCALDVKIYNENKSNEVKELENNQDVKDFNFYIQKFNLTDDINILKKAEKLAVTKSEKAIVEKGYIDFISDYRKVFKLDTSSISGTSKKDDDVDILFIKDLSKSKNLRYKIKLGKNRSTPIPLKYGDYKISVDFTLVLTYDVGYTLGSTTFAKTKTKEHHKTMVFDLNRKNGYLNHQTIDFGEFVVASRGSFTGVGIQSKISQAILKSKIVEVKLK